MRALLRLLPWLLGALAVAVAVHLASVACLPQLVMERAMARMGAVNAIHHGPRATAERHGVVRPSPDLLYSVCPYDLSKAALFVGAPVPRDTYWSVSLFDDSTNNFYTLNDREVGNDREVALVLVDKHSPLVVRVGTDGAKPRAVSSPTTHGLVVFRTLVNDERRLGELDAIRRQARCRPLG
ncbi:MAG TPA: DUF1254 domain-containing protein [Rhizomicrobium sp.]|nr:DUF1254 domain-containing protein [Rhizomicrobium sp.]